MKRELLKKIIKKKEKKIEFAIITNLENGEGCIFEKYKPLDKNFKKIEFKISNESAWEVGLACGGEIAIFLEQIK